MPPDSTVPKTIEHPDPDYIWGYLEPSWHTDSRIAMRKEDSGVPLNFGNSRYNLTWDGAECVFITDLSWTKERRILVNATKLEYNEPTRIHDGSEISFGSGSENQYIFRQKSSVFAPPHTCTSSSSESTSTGLPLPRPIPALSKLYTPETHLARDSFSVIVRARHNYTGAVRAVKIVDPYLSRRGGPGAGPDPRSPADDMVLTIHNHVADEVTNMRRLEHKNVCRIFGSFVDRGSGVLTLILEHVEGGNLQQYVESRGEYNWGMPEDDAKPIFYQICSGVEFIHSMEIMHRDLKPENILLTKDTPPRIKIAGFEFSKKIDGDNDAYESSSTQIRKRRHSVCGSEVYAAPEIIKAAYDHRVDCFSVGMIMHFMLTAKVPFGRNKRRRIDIGGDRDGDGEREGKEGERNEKEKNVNDEDSKVSTLVRHIQERILNFRYLKRRNLSENAYAIILFLILHSPDERLSMKDALQSPWFDNVRRLVNGHRRGSDIKTIINDIDNGKEKSEPGAGCGVQVQAQGQAQGQGQVQVQVQAQAQASPPLRRCPRRDNLRLWWWIGKINQGGGRRIIDRFGACLF
ncbi:kinase-like protein [Pholiota conissans]|uniref:non-specific serine/threonine protein kinase n=1 Tax=Pholiota conissans TaxID=109636 RepID=A0A9P6CRA2_9AGAR|nr:kinase-like protein [Pholiota conissans]